MLTPGELIAVITYARSIGAEVKIRVRSNSQIGQKTPEESIRAAAIKELMVKMIRDSLEEEGYLFDVISTDELITFIPIGKFSRI